MGVNGLRSHLITFETFILITSSKLKDLNTRELLDVPPSYSILTITEVFVDLSGFILGALDRRQS
jgi:hypothetical protein